MLSNSLNKFERAVQVLYGYLDLQDKQQSLIKYFEKEVQLNNFESEYFEEYKKNRTNTRSLTNVLIIIFLYGNFETFIENIIREYISNLKKICKSYDELNSKIRSDYIHYWKSLHGKLAFDKFSHIEEKSLVQSLYESIVSNKNSLVAECFLQNGGNYKSSVIAKTLSNLGLDDYSNEIIKYEPFKLNANFIAIDEIVTSRNEIAHVGNISNIKSNDMLKDSIAIVLSYARSLTLYLKDKLYANLWVALKQSNDVFNAKKIYSKQNAVEFESTNVCFAIDYFALVQLPKTNFPRYLSTKVQSIHVKKNNGIIPCEYISEDMKTSFSVKFSTNTVKPKSQVIFTASIDII